MSTFHKLYNEIGTQAKPYKFIIPLENHFFLAIVTLLVSISFIFLNIILPKKSGKQSGYLATFKYVFYSVVASFMFGFGVIFLTNSVGVYA